MHNEKYLKYDESVKASWMAGDGDAMRIFYHGKLGGKKTNNYLLMCNRFYFLTCNNFIAKKISNKKNPR